MEESTNVERHKNFEHNDGRREVVVAILDLFCDSSHYSWGRTAWDNGGDDYGGGHQKNLICLGRTIHGCSASLFGVCS